MENSIEKQNPVIEVKNVWVSYDTQTVLEDINLTVNESDFIGLINSPILSDSSVQTAAARPPC